ncbi:hypothetical protein EXT66_22890, partial [Pectobacterium carotovorum subsp. carotovorum]|nr:hypothetical protein [Pectobacterium carotovorum subsp. carotovorum]
CLSNKSNIDSSINTDTTAATKNCGPDPYLIIHESSQFIDQQFLKLQEIPESVPVGEMPRNITMSCDRYLTNNVVPGTRVTIVGIYSIYNSKKIGGGASDSNGGVAIRTPYIKILGIQKDIDINTSSNNLNMFSEDEEEEFLTMARRDDIYQLLTKSIAPSIFGNEDI